MNDKEKLVEFIEKASLALLGGMLLLFPLVFTDVMTDFFILPKEALLAFVVLALILLYGVKTFFAEKIKVVRTPFDIAVLLFLTALLLSTIFSVAKFDSLFNFVPLLLSGLSFFAITYNARNAKSVNALLLALLTGGALVALISALNFLKIYVFPYAFAKTQTFTTLGSVLDVVIYLGMLLPLSLYLLYPYIKKGKSIFAESDAAGATQQKPFYLIALSALTITITIGFTISLYVLLTMQKPVILPLATGFQTAFAAISQDSARLIQGFLFGSGFGEFPISFLRFKQAAFNQYASYWNLTFFRSTTYALELLTTAGIAGLISFIVITARVVREKKPNIAVIIAFAAAFVLPFSFYHAALLFFILGIHATKRSLTPDANYFEEEFALVVSKKGYLVLSNEGGSRTEKYGRLLSSTVLILCAVFTLVLGFLSFDFLKGNINFQKSLVFAQQNNGSQTYTLQSNVLATLSGKYVDAYHRVFSQTNLALANSLASSVPQGSSPSAQTTQTIYTLVQQSINSGRQATTISPFNALNWQNLSSIYRALIGFGQNADSFAILAAQQSTALDPTNPQEYINLGGIYYQLKLWDRAIEQFQIAINLKPDFANAYYNYSYALWQKGDLQGALTGLNKVKDLVKNDPQSLSKIQGEIDSLQKQIGLANPTSPELNQPATTLPPQNPPVKIPAPETVVSPSPSITPSPTPTVKH